MNSFKIFLDSVSLPHFSNLGAKTGVIAHGGAEYHRGNNADPLLWTAFLPLSEKPQPNAVKLTIKSIRGDVDAESDPVAKELNESDEFDQVRADVCKYFENNKDKVDELRSIEKAKVISSETSITSNPTPESHKDGQIYLRCELNCDDASTLMCYWSFNLLNGKLILNDFACHKLGINYTKQSDMLKLVAEIVQGPDLASLNPGLVNASVAVNEIDHNIQLNYAVNDNVNIDYRSAGKLAAMSHVVNLAKGLIMFTWESESLGPGDWDMSFTGISLKNNGKWDHIDGDELNELGYSLPDEVYDFSRQQCIDVLFLNHNYTQRELVAYTLAEIKKHKENGESDFRIYGSHFNGDNNTVSCQVAHTLHIRERFVRVFWDTKLNLDDGFMAWPNAVFKFKQIRISGIKYIYFSDSKGFDKVIGALGDDYLENSLILSRKAMVAEHEPFFPFVVGEFEL